MNQQNYYSSSPFAHIYHTNEINVQTSTPQNSSTFPIANHRITEQTNEIANKREKEKARYRTNYELISAENGKKNNIATKKYKQDISF